MTPDRSRCFSAALQYLLDKQWGEASRLADAIGLTASAITEYKTGRRRGSEERRRTIAAHFKYTYEGFLNLGAAVIEGRPDPEQAAASDGFGSLDITAAPEWIHPLTPQDKQASGSLCLADWMVSDLGPFNKLAIHENSVRISEWYGKGVLIVDTSRIGPPENAAVHGAHHVVKRPLAADPLVVKLFLKDEGWVMEDYTGAMSALESTATILGKVVAIFLRP